MNTITAAAPAKTSPYPDLVELDGVLSPVVPRDLSATEIDREVLADLALKTAGTAPQCASRWVSEQMRLPLALVEELLQQLTRDRLLEVLGSEGPFNNRYAVTARGRERSARLLSVSGYVGPAPVTLDAYSRMMHFHHSRLPEISLEDVRSALSELVLPPEDILTAALAVISQRSLFLYGPSGNGKTSVARLLHNAMAVDLWVPYALGIGNDIIRVYDPQVHQDAVQAPTQSWKYDRRWVRIQRPLVVAGGEMTIETLELAFTAGRGFYEAPLHVKANGGTFVIDDLGRQRVEPTALLNRWIIPMEHGFDYFTLQSGHKIRVPFLQMLIVATNLDPHKVMDPAFLRRMGYRLLVDTPSPQRYQQIFAKVAARWGVDVPEDFMPLLFERYRRDARELRCCEPRDLIGRIHDICQLRRQPMHLDDDVLALAWTSYFGANQQLNE